VVAIRASSYRVGFPSPHTGLRFLVDQPASLQSKGLREAFMPTLAAGALFMVGLAGLIMWALAARRATLLLLAGLCLAGAGMQALQALRWFFQYAADWHYPVYVTMAALVALQGLLVVAFEVAHFNLPRGGWVVAALAPALGLVVGLAQDRTQGTLLLAGGTGAALACAAWACWLRRPGAWPVLVGLALTAFLMTGIGEDFRTSFFPTFLPALLGVICSLAVRLRAERRQAREAQLTAARLEIELLKKNLQPHFLLNTLTAVSEVIEQDPKGAVDFIDDLAAEFRSLASMSGEKLVPLHRELELCRTHLKVVGRRTGCALDLQAEAVDGTLVPPALFLTLVENGLIYQRAKPGESFRLAQSGDRSQVRFVLVSPGRPTESAGRLPGGTGLRYVKARLEENFPGHWTFAHGAVPAGWETTIAWRLPAAGGGGA
jgi:hypothetical protein